MANASKQLMTNRTSFFCTMVPAKSLRFLSVILFYFATILIDLWNDFPGLAYKSYVQYFRSFQNSAFFSGKSTCFWSKTPWRGVFLVQLRPQITRKKRIIIFSLKMPSWSFKISFTLLVLVRLVIFNALQLGETL